MKTIATIATIALLTITTSSFAACKLTLSLKKEGAKTAYADDGVSVSQKIQDALAVQCTITKRIMPKSEVNAMKLATAKKRYEKLLNESK